MISCKEFYKRYLNLKEEPYQYQEKVWEIFKMYGFPAIIKAPTGSGKTEAVVAPFLAQFANNDYPVAPKLVYVLPMKVLVNSIAERIRRYAKNVSPNISVKVQHGEAPHTPFFMADIIITTLDQFIYGYARASEQVGHHLDISAGAIASSLVVFDETHMYRDEFTFSMMRAMLEILNASRVPFVLMTATIPQSLENSLFENIKIDKDNKIVINKFGLDNAINISLGQEPIYENSEVNITSQLLEEIQAKKTLLVLNQVKRAQKVYEEIKDRLELKEGAEIILLHSRFTREDRRIHEDEAIKTLPHKKDGRLVIPDGVGIVVTTQVLEAGIDFSAELLLTELAPADSLVQRAGRCARYRDEKGKMVIFPVENEKGHLPYEKPYLEKTWQWLEKHTDFNIKDFSSVSDFVNILDYKADDFAARDSLIDLYEAVLYADTKPENIQIREGKSVNLVVVDFGLGVGKKKKNEMILEAIKKTNIKEHSLSVDFRFAWGIKDKLKCELNYDIKEEKWKIKDIKTQISPFKTYIIENNDYDSKIGVKYDEFTAF